ncbi:hypothetical protein BDA96_10G075800 [Sorghum bicolor]|uniref:Uncharacterized protein n=2 Tax=Sorghum bicolor TaxID=4558 RepID=A0A921PZM5_SORBI|nr:hypothetical protein BDA96_10G075800 [Sorghum bicolor]OQU75964.1 hypothetical protein SORBI_3010G063433 [Sorghum bicolor]
MAGSVGSPAARQRGPHAQLLAPIVVVEVWPLRRLSQLYPLSPFFVTGLRHFSLAISICRLRSPPPDVEGAGVPWRIARHGDRCGRVPWRVRRGRAAVEKATAAPWRPAWTRCGRRVTVEEVRRKFATVGIVLNSIPLNNVSFQRTLVGHNLATWFEPVSGVLR